MSMWNDQIVNVEIQNFVELEISETEPGFKETLLQYFKRSNFGEWH